MKPFRSVTVVGVGLIGGSIGMAVRRSTRARVTGVDRPAVLRRARARGAIDAGVPGVGRGVAGADLVVLALPVPEILALLPRLARSLPPGAVVTDTGSTKGAIVRAARRAGLGERFVGGHPMAGSERSGIRHADPHLFRGAAWILCPAPEGTPVARRVAGLVRRLGARPSLLEARAHDRIVSRLSHMPQLVSVALTIAAGRAVSRDDLRLAGPSFRQMSRLADSPPDLWDGILTTNGIEAGRALDEVMRELRRLRGALRTGTAIHFRRAARVRRRLRS